MRLTLSTKNNIEEVLLYILNKLPKHLGTSIYEFLSKEDFPQISEIRLHSKSYATLIANSKNLRTDIFISQGDINEVMVLLCDGSVYAHFDTIKEGYISIGNGIRAGICGRASVENGVICSINDINAINIRLPKRIPHSADYLFSLLKDSNFSKSIILYSRPGAGKTTILRELIYLISCNDLPIRHAVIDSREEITTFMDTHLMTSDIFVSYPKGLAIEIATKSMTPELIICDEISSFQEASAILRSSNCGVKLIATAHADSFEELCSKEILEGLFRHKVFDYALGIHRDIGSQHYKFTLNKL